MMMRFILVGVFCSLTANAVIVDRIAIVAGKKIIKDSDIDYDLRLTAFLNHEPVTVTPATRKTAASRLLDQKFIREEIDAGGYPQATAVQVQEMTAGLVKSRFSTSAAFQRELATYKLSEEDLKVRLMWQLTILRFIDLRFRSSANVTDEEIQKYFDAHKSQFSGDLKDSRPKIEEIISGERTNTAFYGWLDRKRKAATLRYLEDGLQ